MLQISGSRNHDAGRDIETPEILLQVHPGKTFYALRSTNNGIAERMIVEDGAVEMVVDQLLGVVLEVFQFLDNHFLLLSHFLDIEKRIPDKVRNHVERFQEIVIQNAGVKAGLFLGCESVQIAPPPFQAPRDLLGRIALSSLEDHVFEEV